MNRAQMLNAVEGILLAVKESKTRGPNPTVFIPKTPDFTDEQKAEDEYEALGYFVTYNPLEKYKFKLMDLISTADLPDIQERSTVKMGGLVTNLKEITTKKGQQMAFFELEDFNGRVEVVAFTNVYKKSKELFVKNKPVHVTGKLEIQTRYVGGEEVVTPKIVLFSIGELEEGKKLKKIVLNPNKNDDFQRIHDIIVANPGDIPVEIVYHSATMLSGYKVLSDKAILNDLESSCLLRREYVN